MRALTSSPCFGIALTVLAYWLGLKIQKKTGLVILNNLLLGGIFIIAVLVVFDIPYDAYYEGGGMIHMFLGPATGCMALNIYRKRDLLKRYWLPVLVGCGVSVVASVGSVLLMCRLFGLDDVMAITLLPKSVTTPIAVAISAKSGGIPSITSAMVVLTGILGNLMAPIFVKVFPTKDPMAAGLGIGACSHALGTAKALEIGETEGAMSGLAVGICGILTAVAALAFPYLV